MFSSGDAIGKYRLVRQLGRGGMGEVWLATASGYGGFTKTVVVKTLLPELSRDPLFIEMLAHEARICAKLSHPNLIEVFDFSEHDGVYLLAMEHVAGRPLNQVMRTARARGWSLPAWFALRVAWECCRGLECAHEQGIIHCDLSPSNVMVTFTGLTKILDFGVAHSSALGPKPDRLKGKFPYMAPERIRSLVTDRRTDVYALGVMLFLMFTGQLPFTGPSDRALLDRIVSRPPPRPSDLCPIDGRVEQIIVRAMQADPAARYQDAGELLAALATCLDGQLGAYGQQDVAAFVGRLFAEEEADAEYDDTHLPPMPRLEANDDVAELDSVDIEVESLLEIPQEAAAPSSDRPANDTFARGSAPMRPLDKHVSRVFSSVAALGDTRTTVQSLFGERPSRGPDVSRVFERPAREPPGLDEPRAPAPAGFGRYSSRSRPETPEWPWPTSRTKSD